MAIAAKTKRVILITGSILVALIIIFALLYNFGILADVQEGISNRLNKRQLITVLDQALKENLYFKEENSSIIISEGENFIQPTLWTNQMELVTGIDLSNQSELRVQTAKNEKKVLEYGVDFSSEKTDYSYLYARINLSNINSQIDPASQPTIATDYDFSWCLDNPNGCTEENDFTQAKVVKKLAATCKNAGKTNTEKCWVKLNTNNTSSKLQGLSGKKGLKISLPVSSEIAYHFIDALAFSQTEEPSSIELKNESNGNNNLLFAEPYNKYLPKNYVPTKTDAQNKRIFLFAAKNEYEPATFYIFSAKKSKASIQIKKYGQEENINLKNVRLSKIDYSIKAKGYGFEVVRPKEETQNNTLFEDSPELLSDIACTSSKESLGCINLDMEKGINGFFLDINFNQFNKTGLFKNYIEVAFEGGEKQKINLDIASLPITLAEPIRDFGMFYRNSSQETYDCLKSNSSLTNKCRQIRTPQEKIVNYDELISSDFEVMASHGVQTPILFLPLKSAGIQATKTEGCENNIYQSANDDPIDYCRLNSILKSWKDHYVKYNDPNEKDRPKIILSLTDALDSFVNTKNCPYQAKIDALSPSHNLRLDCLTQAGIDQSGKMMQSLQDKFSPNYNIYFMIYDELSGPYNRAVQITKGEWMPSECAGREEECKEQAQAFINNLKNLYEAPKKDGTHQNIQYFIILQFASSNPETISYEPENKLASKNTELENTVSKYLLSFDTPSNGKKSILSYNGRTIDWAESEVKKQKNADLDSRDIEKSIYYNHPSSGKVYAKMGMARRITNGIYFWENPYDQFGVWTYQSYWSDPKTEKEIVSEDTSNYEFARDILYAYPDEKDYSPHPTILLKNYREGIDDFKYFKTLRSCSIEKFKAIQEKYQKYGPEAERYSGYLDALTLQKIRLETAKEILNCT